MESELTKTITETLFRLLIQLKDLTEMRDHVEEKEYEKLKKDMLQQTGEFEQFLWKNKKENEMLVDAANDKLEEWKQKAFNTRYQEDKDGVTG